MHRCPSGKRNDPYSDAALRALHKSSVRLCGNFLLEHACQGFGRHGAHIAILAGPNGDNALFHFLIPPSTSI